MTPGVTHVTVTVNAVEPQIAQRIYSMATIKGQVYRGLEATRQLLSRQEESVLELKRKGLIVKINTVVLPGINLGHIPAIAEKAALWGADAMNCMPLIPVHGTPFAGLVPPDGTEMALARKAAAFHLPQIYHCRRCRADAAGLLGEVEHKGCGLAQSS